MLSLAANYPGERRADGRRGLSEPFAERQTLKGTQLPCSQWPPSQDTQEGSAS